MAFPKSLILSRPQLLEVIWHVPKSICYLKACFSRNQPLEISHLWASFNLGFLKACQQ
jgi:hypothetical protein